MPGQMKGVSDPHGVKRPAEEALDNNEQRLTKRLGLLNLGTSMPSAFSKFKLLMYDIEDRNGRVFVPVDKGRAGRQSTTRCASNEMMQLDDTKDKVYIHDLEDELSESDSHEESMVFLPDIEKHLSKIPKAVLGGVEAREGQKEMVLYQVPSSISVPKEHDNVRKAIIESRARTRAKQAQERMALGLSGGAVVQDPSNRRPSLESLALSERDTATEDAMDLG
ncbi:MAG: hypothetical protein M1833_002567 [Piccolia ochrophora]|nr:MAG: hypothetical protein M1833_002567 [Piccolia ochrophora]